MPRTMRSAVVGVGLGFLVSGVLLVTTPTAAGILDVTWTAPTTNTDGSPLTDLASFRVYYNTSGSPCPGSSSWASVPSPTSQPGPGRTVSIRLSGLTTGTLYHVSVAATNAGGNQSACSSSASGQARADFAVSPAGTVNFGSVSIGSFAERTFTVSNTGGGSLSGTVAVAAPFTIVSGSPFALDATRTTQSVTVRFTPTTTATVSSNIRFTAGGGTISTTVTGAGAGSGAGTPAPAPGTAQGVVWTNLANATADGGSLSKTGGCDGCYDAGGVSQQQINGGDGFVEFTAGAAGPLRMAGLTGASTVRTPGEILFGIRLQGSSAEVREGGVYRAATPYSAADVFRIAVQSGVVRYSKNGTVFYTSTISPTYPLMMGAALANRPSGIQAALITGSGSGSGSGSGTGSAAGVSWTNPVNATANGGTLTKTSGCNGCFDAGAASQQQITGGNGYAQFTAGPTGPLRVVGLTSSFSGTNPGSIAFGLRLQGSVAEVREGGVYRADTSFAAGDVFRIAVQGGVVRYSKNGTVFFTSATAPPSTLTFAAAIASLNGSIVNAALANGQ